jgi:hypothetical protein
MLHVSLSRYLFVESKQARNQLLKVKLSHYSIDAVRLDEDVEHQ